MASYRAAVFFMLFGAAASVSDECLYTDACSEDEVMATEEAVMQKTRVDLLSLRVSDSAVRSKGAASAGPGQLPVVIQSGMYGASTCQCIGMSNISGMVDLTLMGTSIKYPADFGSSCHAWDAGRHPDCNAASVNKPSWCARQWCYVDPCSCTGLQALPTLDTEYVTDGRYQSKKLYRSYTTCNPSSIQGEARGTGDAVQDAVQIGLECALPVDNLVVGSDDCQCIGIKGLGAGALLNRTWNGKLNQYPADTGSYCKTWDQDHSSECVGLAPPDWCQKQWCFVDPCACKNVRNAPKPSGFNGLWRGKPLYASYDTCGDDITVGTWAQPAMCR